MCAHQHLTNAQALGPDWTRSPAACPPPVFSRYLLLIPVTAKPPLCRHAVLEGKAVRSSIYSLDYLVSEPASFIKNLKYPSCPCAFPAVPRGASAHGLGTIKTMVGIASYFTSLDCLQWLSFQSSFLLLCLNVSCAGDLSGTLGPACKPWLKPPLWQHSKRLNYLMISLPPLHLLKFYFEVTFLTEKYLKAFCLACLPQETARF